MSACELEGGRRRAAWRLDPRAALSPPPRRVPAPPRPFFPAPPGKDPCLSVFSGFLGWRPHASVPSFRAGPSSILFPPSPGPSRWDSSFHFFQGPRAAGWDPSAVLLLCSPDQPQVGAPRHPLSSSLRCPTQFLHMFPCLSTTGTGVYLPGSLEGESPASPLLQSL